MKKTLALIIALAMMLSLGITASAAERKEINIFMWSDYISDDLIANFEDEYGVRVNLSYMNDNADSITKLTAGAGDGYDLIMTCDAYMESLIAGGYLEELDLSYNQISDVITLNTCVRLQRLDLTGNPLTADAVRRLQEALPGCRIVTDADLSMPEPTPAPPDGAEVPAAPVTPAPTETPAPAIPEYPDPIPVGEPAG